MAQALLQLRPSSVNEAEADHKLNDLRALLRDMGSLVLGYSGGVDSAFLAKVAQEELGDRAVAVVALSESYADREKEAAVALAESHGIRLRTVRTNELENEHYAANPTNRCFYCKEELFVHLRRVAEEMGIPHIAYGAIIDDLGDHRPGAQAAEEYGARAPLQEAMLSKAEIRVLSRRMGLPTWDKPSLACLSSRFPYGTRITADLLRRLDRCEEFLHDLGFRQVRVRHHDTIARIEIERGEFGRVLEGDVADRIVARFKELGYTYVSLDLAGYRSGSMNANLGAVRHPAGH
uniref:ATP-utilizing enzyme of the PP-loop superfamily n=1 Tax=uncultured Armatimonadetes bacterium TaxID=157466 RepID=A0A6J4I2H2_9BACT|nr:ATP-utilizing enzyme of the PP-loop superfamily [uncultured Armatimonadetes bacterium]